MEVERVEGSPEVDVERLIPLSGEYPPAVLQGEDPLGCQLFVVWRGPGADVRRHRVHRAGAYVFGLLAKAYFCDRVTLPHK